MDKFLDGLKKFGGAIVKYTKITLTAIRNFYKKFEVARLVTTLFLITSIIATLLAAVNSVTAPVILQNEINAMNQALSEFLPKATEFTETPLDENTNDIIDSFYIAKDGEDIIGYAVNTVVSGFGGDMKILVVCDENLTIVNSKVISHVETQGIGSKEEIPFINQFIGLSENTDAVDAISGATISSNAYKLGIRTALAFLRENTSTSSSDDGSTDTPAPSPYLSYFESATDFVEGTLTSDADAVLTNFITAKNGEEILGYIVKTSVDAYEGPLEILTIFDKDSVITETVVAYYEETKGLGTDLQAPFESQFVGITDSTEQIDAMSGATASSNAYKYSVQAAIDYLKTIKEGANE